MRDYGRKSVYVSLIPQPVVDWFSKHTMDEIHDQVAMYIALYEIEQEYANKNVIGDTHSSYNPAIQHHLRNFCDKYPHLSKEYIPLGPHDIFEKENTKIEDYNAFFQRKTAIEEEWRKGNPQEAQLYDDKKDNLERAWGNLLENLFNAEKLPKWFLKKNEVEITNGQTYYYLSLQKLKRDENFGWQRPTGALADDFGIVSYGITYRDERRLQGQKIDYDEKTDEEVIKKLTTKELKDAKIDTLSRTESDAKAFEFLMYAKSKGKEWPNWSISNAKHTGYIYLYSDGRAYKIGFSYDHPELEKRKRSMQTSNSGLLKLIGYIEGTREKETILHKKYQHKRTQGEWFDLSLDDIKSFLAGNETMDH